MIYEIPTGSLNNHDARWKEIYGSVVLNLKLPTDKKVGNF